VSFDPHTFVPDGGIVPLTLEQTWHLFKCGRYLDIVTDGVDRDLAAKHPEHRVLLAHAMFLAGRSERARAIVDQERERVSGIVRARCELIDGMLCRDGAQFGKALQHYNVAFQIAREQGDDLETAWAALYRFRLLAQLHSSDELAPMLADVRRYVAKAGNAHVSAHMHDAVAQMEASNGRTEEARRHLDISASLIRAYPNAGLEQIGFISSSFVDFFECRYQSAVSNLNAARKLSSVTGSKYAGVIDCNLGHAALVLGKLDAAENHFVSVLNHGTPTDRFSALEGLARVYLASGDLERCAQTLETHESYLLHDRALALAFSGRWASATQVRLLLKHGKYDEAAATAKTALEKARGLADRILDRELTCLLTEALVLNGKPAAGGKELLQLVAKDSFQAGNMDAMYYRALGRLVDEGFPAVGYEFLQRAKHIYSQQTNKNGESELEPLIKRRSRSASESTNDVPLLVLGAVASALATADSPELIGRELTRLAALLGCSVKTDLNSASDFTTTERQVVLRLGATGPSTALRFEMPSEPHGVAVLAELIRIGSQAVELQQFRHERRRKAALWPADPVETGGGALFLAEEMQTLVATARRVAATNVPVLITGETGTGKEVLARAVHGYSHRSKAAFLPFNCTSTPRDMLDSQLFGHRRGSFTGAIENFQGIIRGAGGGTLFLDEIGDMALEVQPKLLRFLESGEVHPVGETQPVRADVRVIAATNANLDALVSDGRFREDLFYRLNIVHLQIPPLRERRIEIPALAQHYLDKYAAEYAKGNLRLAEETMEYLVLYRWPGNVRQLANEMRRMAALCEAGAVVMPEHLSAAIAASRRTIPPSERMLDPTEVVVRLDQPMAAATEHLERTMLQYALKQCGGRMEETAARLGLSRKGLYLKRQRFGIEPPESAAVGV
jgi:DNA-binding NtrC family response regulator/tetratricopeptide (TPR) repeat protein